MTSLNPPTLPFNENPSVPCKACHELKPLDEFYIDKRYGTPKQPCKSCWVTWERRARNADPEGFRERRQAIDRRWRQNNPENAAAKDRRQREKLRATGNLQQIDRAKNLWWLYKRSHLTISTRCLKRKAVSARAAANRPTMAKFCTSITITHAALPEVGRAASVFGV